MQKKDQVIMLMADYSSSSKGKIVWSKYKI